MIAPKTTSKVLLGLLVAIVRFVLPLIISTLPVFYVVKRLDLWSSNPVIQLVEIIVFGSLVWFISTRIIGGITYPFYANMVTRLARREYRKGQTEGPAMALLTRILVDASVIKITLEKIILIPKELVEQLERHELEDMGRALIQQSIGAISDEEYGKVLASWMAVAYIRNAIQRGGTESPSDAWTQAISDMDQDRRKWAENIPEEQVQWAKLRAYPNNITAPIQMQEEFLRASIRFIASERNEELEYEPECILELENMLEDIRENLAADMEGKFVSEFVSEFVNELTSNEIMEMAMSYYEKRSGDMQPGSIKDLRLDQNYNNYNNEILAAVFIRLTMKSQSISNPAEALAKLKEIGSPGVIETIALLPKQQIRACLKRAAAGMRYPKGYDIKSYRSYISDRSRQL